MPYDSYYTAAFFICLVLFTDFLKDNKNSANNNFYNFGLHGCCFKRERKCWFRFVLRVGAFFDINVLSEILPCKNFSVKI